MKSISVWLATYNGETFLQQQLDGIARQTYLPAELVASDDGSTDGTIGILEDFASSAPFPVHIHHNTTSQGYRFNFMHGLTFCRSDLIALCDQDDLWDPRKLLVAQKEFEDHPDALLVFHNAWLACSENNRLRALDIYQMAPRNPPLTMHNLFNPRGFSMVFDRRLMRFSGLWPRSISSAIPGLLLAHDAWVFFLSAISGTLVYSDLKLIAYCQHSSNVVGALDRGLAANLRHRFRFLVNHGGGYQAQAHAIHLRARILADSADRLNGLWRERALAGELKWPTILRPISRTGKALPRRQCVRARIVSKLYRSGAYPPMAASGERERYYERRDYRHPPPPVSRPARTERERHSMTSTGEMASKAATEVATCEELPNGIETRIGVPSWISGTALALCLTILFRVFH